MKEFKIGEFLYTYSFSKHSVIPLEITGINDSYIYLKGESGYTYNRNLLEMKSLLESDNLYVAYRRNRMELISLAYKVQLDAMENEITNFEKSIFSLREEIQNLIEWRKKEIAATPKSKKTITINCSVPTFVIH